MIGRGSFKCRATATVLSQAGSIEFRFSELLLLRSQNVPLIERRHFYREVSDFFIQILRRRGILGNRLRSMYHAPAGRWTKMNLLPTPF